MSDAAPLTLAERAAATQAVLAQFREKPFSLERRVSCLHAYRALLVAFGESPPPIPLVRTVLGAKRALNKAGYPSLMAMLDAQHERIAPSRMRVGDVALLPGEDGNGRRALLDTIVFHVGGGKVLGWHGADTGGMAPIVVTAPFLGAWRVK